MAAAGAEPDGRASGATARSGLASWQVLFAIVLQPIVVKSLLLLNILKADPVLKLSGLGSASFLGLPVQPTLDPNVGYTSHALGTYAARALFAGRSLWWNPLEGVGTPLAGEMQSAALFPPTWLMILPNGQLLEHLLFQIIAGVATFLLVRRLGLGLLASWFAATAFSFNGTFAWLGNAVINPVCFLPVMLLGIELVRTGIRGERTVGGLCIVSGLAASLYAGFPEVAYIDGLLVAGWTLVRCSEAWRVRAHAVGFAAAIGGLAVCGALLAAPLLAAFADYLSVSIVGIHGGAIVSPLQPVYAAMFLVPYLPGAISHAPVAFWNSIGGYAGIGLTAFALAGLAVRPERRLRWYLAAWTAVALCAIYGIAPISTLVQAFPGLRVTATYRYVEPTVSLALAVLAGFGVDALIERRGRRVVRRSVIAVVLIAALLCLVAALHGILPVQKVEYAPLALDLIVVAAFVAAVFIGRDDARWRPLVITAAAAIEIVALFAIPMTGYPLRREPVLGGVAFLQRNLGMQRFTSAGAASLPGSITANYGSYFGIAQVNWNDLPVPRQWIDYARRHFDPRLDPVFLQPTPAAAAQRLSAYAAVGTRYLTVPAADTVPGLIQVAGDRQIRVYELTGYRRYFEAAGCTIDAVARDAVRTRCARPARLERLELSMPGWSARVNGVAAPIQTVGEIFQGVVVPRGVATTTFAFRPPHLTIGIVLAGIGGFLSILLLALIRYRPDLTGGGRSPQRAEAEDAMQQGVVAA